MRSKKSEVRSAPGGLVLTRAELAAVLRVSVRTVDRMVTAEDIPAMDLGEDLVRFYLPDVLEALRSGKRKHGRKVGQVNIEHSTFNIQHPSEEKAGRASEQKAEVGGRSTPAPKHTSPGLRPPSPQRGEGTQSQGRAA